MTTTDAKLYRIFVVAGERAYVSRAELSREIASRRLEEFSYEEDDQVKYLGWKGVDEYVAFASMIGLLDGENAPYIRVDQVTRKGFSQALGEKVENFAEGAGVSAKRIKGVIQELVGRSPSLLPSPKAIWATINPQITYHIFYKAVTVQAFQERVNLFVKSRQVFMSTDTLWEQK